MDITELCDSLAERYDTDLDSAAWLDILTWELGRKDDLVSVESSRVGEQDVVPGRDRLVVYKRIEDGRTIYRTHCVSLASDLFLLLLFHTYSCQAYSQELGSCYFVMQTRSGFEIVSYKDPNVLTALNGIASFYVLGRRD